MFRAAIPTLQLAESPRIKVMKCVHPNYRQILAFLDRCSKKYVLRSLLVCVELGGGKGLSNAQFSSRELN